MVAGKRRLAWSCVTRVGKLYAGYRWGTNFRGATVSVIGVQLGWVRIEVEGKLEAWYGGVAWRAAGWRERGESRAECTGECTPVNGQRDQNGGWK